MGGVSRGKGSCPLIRETLGSHPALTHWLTGVWASGVIPPALAVLGWLAARKPEAGFAASSWAPRVTCHLLGGAVLGHQGSLGVS